MSPINSVVTVTASTQIVNNSGNPETFDDIFDRHVSSFDTLSINQFNKFTSSCIESLDTHLDTESAELIHLTFANGEDLYCLPGSQLMNAKDQWVPVEELKNGAGLRIVMYNPLHRNPQKMMITVSDVERTPEPLIQTIGFTVKQHDNILIAVPKNDSFILLPFRPSKLTVNI